MKKCLLSLLITPCAALALFASLAFADETALDSDKAKLSYALGMLIHDRVLTDYSDLDYELLFKGAEAQRDGEATQMTSEEAQKIIQDWQQQQVAMLREKAKNHLAENAKREGVEVTESGLQYEVVDEGDGERPTISDTVSVHYVGTLTDGTVFDSSVERGTPAEFPLKGVIPGWTEGLQLMTVGSKYRFVIPSELGYGDRAVGELIGPNETLLFEVDLLEIK